MKNSINYYSGNEELCDEIEKLWLELREVHSCKSTYFNEHFKNTPFSSRKDQFMKQAKEGILRIILAKCDENKVVGFCVSTVEERIGEIQSICISEEYRNMGIGDRLMEKSLEWIRSNNVDKILVKVAVGNEEVFSFYEKHNFYPRLVELQIK